MTLYQRLSHSAGSSNGTAVATLINGPVIKARPADIFAMNDMVEVGDERLTGEVIGLEEDLAVIQVYEDTTGLIPGAEVRGKGLPLHVELGPGLIGSIFDGIQRPLNLIYDMWGDFIKRGRTGHPLSRDRLFHFTPALTPGIEIAPGDVLGTLPESSSIIHRVMAPPSVRGVLKRIAQEGEYSLDDIIAEIEDSDGKNLQLRLFHRWPVRTPRPCLSRLMPAEPLITGQRVIDTFFPITKGGTAAIPGGFGTGKTVTQHQLAKWANADIIVYIGCGERGNEMTSVLEEFPRLLDPRSNLPLIERTVLIANTSDMPVAAREASIYTGITIAEFYRDMGYDVALMADSTSRWAEALREISGRLEEMPAEEGFPAYLASRLAAFYERASQVKTLGGRTGSVTVIGAVSPPGGDFSEPVTINTKRFVQCFWALDKELASGRHFPAINYLQSYSGYRDTVLSWWEDRVGQDWKTLKEKALDILQKDAKLQNIVKLLGEEALPDDQKRIIEGARLIKNGFLQQGAFDPVDTYSSPEKQFLLLDVIIYFIERLQAVVKARLPIFRALQLPSVAKINRLKFTYTGEDPTPFLKIKREIDKEITRLLQ